MPEPGKELLEFAIDLAHVAEREILPRYGRVAVSRKADGTEVTEADRAAEEAIRERLTAVCPDDGVLGEEFGETDAGRSGRRWVIDPLDGTAWFTMGSPLFGTLIALLEKDEPVLGVIHFPVMGETVFAASGLGCRFRAKGQDEVHVRVDPCDRLESAIASSAGAHGSNILPTDGREYNVLALIRTAKVFRFFGDCLQHALVCRGKIHVGLDTIMQPWDIAAIVPCVEEAGGVTSSLEGQRERIVFSGSLLTSSHRRLHEEVLRVLNQ